MQHYEIIRELLNTSTSRYYLQVGVSNDRSFISLVANYKVGLNMTPPTEFISQNLNDSCVYHTTTSDDFFMHIHASSIKFDVIFFSEPHEYEQAYRDIINALDHLSPDGVIIVRNCNPTNERIDINKERSITKGSYIGDVYKAIVRLRTFHDNVSVFTLDCDYGLAIITHGTSDLLLKYHLKEIEAMNVHYFNSNYKKLLNFKPIRYMSTFITMRKNKEKLNSYNFYVEDLNDYVNGCLRDYNLHAIPKVHIIENGVILPIKVDPAYPKAKYGGVCDANGNFVEGHLTSRSNLDQSYNCNEVYPLQDQIRSVQETVVYGGMIFNHFGHMLAESLARMWYFLENPHCSYKFVFVGSGKITFLEFFTMLGMQKDNIILINEPTRFEAIIIPEQSTYLFSGFTNKAMMVYDFIRDSVTPSYNKKIYLTRTQLPIKDTINEEFFENYYRAQGYEIISPEKLSIREQISVLAGASDLVCASGTLAHLILFCHDGINITILNKTRELLRQQIFINQARSAKCTFIDVSMNFLPDGHHHFPYLFMPTVYWKQYIRDQNKFFPEDNNDHLDNIFFEYITQWVKMVVAQPPPRRKYLGKHTLADFIIGVHKYLLETDLDESTRQWLYEAFPRQEAQR